jgi:hypothetical protein
MALKRTVIGGDAYPKVLVDPTNKPDVSAVNVGDTVVFAPGSMRQVVPSPEVQVVLTEDASITKAEVKKSLQINRREGAKIQVMKGRLLHGDVIQEVVPIDVHSADPNKYTIDLVLLAFNRGEKEFRGDLTIYDRPPPELNFISVDTATKYNDQSATKDALSWLPLIQYFAFAMDNYKKLNEPVDLQQEVLSNDVHKYTVRRLVLNPGQAVGFTIHLKYLPPTDQELSELRYDAQPFAVPVQ